MEPLRDRQTVTVEERRAQTVGEAGRGVTLERHTQIENFAGAIPLPLGRSVMPFAHFDRDHQRAIATAVLNDDRPEKWRRFEFGRMPSRAWYEWHWHRGIDPDAVYRSRWIAEFNTPLYPEPIVSLAESRARALADYATMRGERPPQ